MSLPDVSVILPVHNARPYLEGALRSVLDQSLRNIEVIVIDDASTDSSPALLAQMAAEDSRIIVKTLEQNARLPAALNHGLALARAPYIARMDADDYAYPDRLARQKAHLDAHPEVILVGAGVRRVRADGISVMSENINARDDFGQRWLMKFRQSLLHPTWMFRNPAQLGLDLRYDPAFSVNEDHDFIERIMQHGQIVSLPFRALDYRVHDKSISTQNWALQKRLDAAIFDRCIARDYPPGFAARLDDLRAAYFLLEERPAKSVIAGVLALLAHDCALYPQKASWMRRQAAQIIAETLTRRGGSQKAALIAIARHAPQLIPALILRLLEAKGPKWLRQ